MPEEKPNPADELAFPPAAPVDQPPSEATTKVRLTVPHSPADGVSGQAGDVVEVPQDQAERMIAAGTAEAVADRATRRSDAPAGTSDPSPPADDEPRVPRRR